MKEPSPTELAQLKELAMKFGFVVQSLKSLKLLFAQYIVNRQRMI